MTIRLEASAEIDAPIAAVWDVLIDWTGQSRWIPMTTSVDSMLSWSPDGKALFAPASTVGQSTYLVSLEAGAGPPKPLRLTFDFGNGASGPPVWAPRTVKSTPPEPAGTALDPSN